MTDTEMIDCMERLRKVPMPTFEHQATTDGGGGKHVVFVGWTTYIGEHISLIYPTLREAVEAMNETLATTHNT